MAERRLSIGGDSRELVCDGPIGCNNRAITGILLTELFSWESTDKRMVELELLMQPHNQTVNAGVIPLLMRWQMKAYGHGDATYDLPWTIQAAVAPGAQWAMPANGVRCRFAARSCKIYVQVMDPAVTLGITASLSAVHGAALPTTVPMADALGPAAFVLPAFPIGAREFRAHCVNPARIIELRGLDPAFTLVDSQPVATWADWTPIPSAAAFWNRGDALTDVITVNYR